MIDNNNRMMEMEVKVEKQQEELQKQRRRVLICEGFNKIHCVENFRHLPPVEGSNRTKAKQSAIWYSGKDMWTFRQQAQNYTAKDDDDSRGLEGIVDVHMALIKKRLRIRTVQSVLIAQQVAHEHAKESTSNQSLDKFLRRVSCKESLRARQMALLMGRADEYAIQSSQAPAAQAPISRPRKCSQVVAASA